MAIYVHELKIQKLEENVTNVKCMHVSLIQRKQIK